MADVFVSYKKEDLAIARRVVDGLKARDLSVWWDEALTPRGAWDAELEREIAAAATVVVLWTPRSVDSDWVRTEAHYALERRKLIPVMVEPCTIPLAFTLRQTVNLCEWQSDDHRHWRKLLAWIADLTAVRSRDGHAPVAPAPPANAFRSTVGKLASGEPVVDGTFVNVSTPAGTAFRDAELLPVMRIVPSGAFLLGSPESDPDRADTERPQKRVEIPQPFAVGIFPVLVSEYEAVLGARPSVASPAAAPARSWSLFRRGAAPFAPTASVPDPSLPVTTVSFEEATAFVTAISVMTGESYRLPSETEWEYACRAGSRTRYSCGDSIDATMATFARATGPIAPGTLRANRFGLFDMHGSVREWTLDLWHESYDSTPLDGAPALDGHSSMRVVRGGGWSDTAAMLRSAARMRATESIRSTMIGFRVVRTLA